LIEFAEKHPDKELRRFFQHEWRQGDYQAAKAAISARLTNLLLHKGFRALTCGRTTLPLYDLADSGKVVLFSLQGVGAASGAIIGKLVLSMVTVLGDLRKDRNATGRRPVHIFLDECQNFTGPALRAILTELRKFGLYLTMAHQTVSQLGGERQAVFVDTFVKFLGKDELTASILTQMGCDNDAGRAMVRGLAEGCFLVRWGNAATCMLTVRSDLAGDDGNITKSQWHAMKASQRRYYRPKDDDKQSGGQTGGAGEAPDGFSRRID
jgi:hypothetical protein